MKRRVIAFLLIVLLISGVNIKVFATTKTEAQEGINQKTEELEGVKEEKITVLGEIDKLNTSIEETEKEIVKLNDRIDELTKSIEEKNNEINKKEEEFKEKDKLLQDRLVALYEAGDTSYLDLLFTSSSITDFISNYYLVSQLTEYDTGILNSIENAKKEIENVKHELQTQKQEVDKAKNEISIKKEQLDKDKAEKQAKVATLSEEEKAISDELDEFNEVLRKIEAQEKAAEEQRRKEEEAKKKVEEAKSSESTSSSSSFTEATTIVSSSSSGGMTWPIPGYYTITSEFGYRIHPIYGTWKLHTGIDVGAPSGAPFVAADDGVVILAEYNGGYGNCVVISHGNGVSTLYGHGTSILVSEGQTVTKGTPVLTVGSTGNSTGPHAHFEVRLNSVCVNPLNYV